MAGYTTVERHMAGYTQGGIWPGIHRVAYGRVYTTWYIPPYMLPGTPPCVHTVLHVYAATPGVCEESPGLKEGEWPG